MTGPSRAGEQGMTLTEARRTAVALVRAGLVGDRLAVNVLLTALLQDRPAAFAVIQTLAEIAHAALADDRDALARLRHLTNHAEQWPADAPIPWPGRAGGDRS